MSFANPLFLLVIILFVPLLLLLKRPKAWLEHSRGKYAYQMKGFKEVLRRLPGIFLVTAVILVTIDFARPLGGKYEEEFSFEGREMFNIVDTSNSMTGKAMETIKEVLIDFSQKRAKDKDLVGISVYAGTGMRIDDGRAAIVLLPTYDLRLIEKSIKRIKAKEMVGIYTSIGEGLFVTLVALLDKEMGDEFDIERLKASICSKDKSYALELVNYIKRVKKAELKNKVLILFTDGCYNSGIDPAHVFWLMHKERLGIKTYFVAVKPSGATGLSEEDQIKHKKETIRGVLATGGQYFEAEEMGEVKKFYDEIDRIEKSKIVVEFKTVRKDLYFWPTLFALILVGAMVVVESVWLKIP